MYGAGHGDKVLKKEGSVHVEQAPEVAPRC